MTESRHREELIEKVAGAYRPRDLSGGVRGHPAWFDLDASGRAEAFDAAISLRAMEAALDPQGLSTTAKAVLDMIRSDPRVAR